MGYFFPVLLRRCLLATPGTQTGRAIPFTLIGSSRCFSSPTAPTSERIDFPFEDDESSSSFAKSPDDLRSRIFRLRFPKRSATAVIEKWVAEGRKASSQELRRIAMDLRRSQRFKHALEIFMWLDSQSSFQASAADQAAKLDLIIKVDSLANAELYFEQISNTASQKVASLPLLHFYVKQKELTKAEALLTKLCSLSFIVNPHHFNEIMKLYAATGQFKKVIYVIRYMKRNKVCLNVLSYNLWMNACGEVSDVASLEMIYKEMTVDNNVEVGWSTYCTLANIYTRFGLADKAFAALRMAENKLSTKKRLGYSFVMTNYAALGDKNGVLRLWEFSKRVAGKIPCANYMSVMICLVKLGDISEAERIFKAWESQCWKYDIRVPNILLGAHMRNGCMEKVELLFFHALKKGGNPNYKTWEILMEGWVKKKEMDKAVEVMKKGLSMLKHCIWRPSSDILSAIAEYYEEIQNVDDANRFVKVLQRSCLMNLHLYKSFVRTHVKAKRVNPNIPKMMARDGIEPDEEIKLLIQQMTSIISADIYVD
ncbi:pentatricopeptide repeat-containing protein At5g27460 [Phalaenopsis equestris]|uniref:pentatricopeptide repeat-containing protein At5g27460 n=1 Tax=Phalaenopsis equestris TaxID=78828 RepID=UPI0009E2DF7F|nr:pentatricopeptide repeat-containing protein At5g27460 [Phalaenopsis equestris]